MIIADTCLIFHLFNESSFTSLAQRILEKESNWIFPTLWREEYANILSKLARKEHKPKKEIINHFEFTIEQLKAAEVFVETTKALEISLNYKITVYDAHFISLAIDYKTLVITEDNEIIKKCPHLSTNFLGFLKEY